MNELCSCHFLKMCYDMFSRNDTILYSHLFFSFYLNPLLHTINFHACQRKPKVCGTLGGFSVHIQSLSIHYSAEAYLILTMFIATPLLIIDSKCLLGRFITVNDSIRALPNSCINLAG